jgi:hypothetical protein
MRKILIIMTLVMLLAGVISCGQNIAGASTQSAGDLTPPAPVQSGFNFIFKYGVTARNTLDTFQGTFTKDMVMDPAITIKLALSQQEMDDIFQKMVEIDFFNYPDKFSVNVADNETKVQREPYPTYFFLVENGGKTRELLWHDKYVNSDIKGDKLKELINFIQHIIESKEDYKQLPEPRSGYL